MKALARTALLLVVILVVVSAYLRLHHSGIGCPEWPVCYGRIGAPPGHEESLARSAYERIVAESTAPLAWAAPLHRLVASLLGLTIFFLALLAFRNRRYRSTCLALLALTVFLAIIGLRSGGMHSKAIVMGNLAGGFAMLGLLGALVFRESARRSHGAVTAPATRWLVLAATTLLGLQILLGGFTSANFAAVACHDLPACNGGYWPDEDIASALDLREDIRISGSGHAVGGAERQAIHRAHRLGAVLSLLLILAAAASALRHERLRVTAWAVIALVLAEFAIGIASVNYGLPIGLAVAHNWLAALLLLGMVRLAVSAWPRNPCGALDGRVGKDVEGPDGRRNTGDARRATLD